MRWADRMFRFLVFLTVIWFVGLGAWWLGTTLSSDAIGLALGVIFGIVAALPGSLLALTAGRRSAPAQPQPPSPPVIFLAGGAPAALPSSERPLLVDTWSKPQGEQARSGGYRGNSYQSPEVAAEMAAIWAEQQAKARQAPRVVEGEVQPQRSSPVQVHKESEGDWYDA